MDPKHSIEQSLEQPNHIRNVAIVGGSGQIGKHLLEHILKTNNFDVIAIQRPDSNGTLPSSVRVIRVDYNDDDDTRLVEVLRGQQALVITMSVTAPRDTVCKLAVAAVKAKVRYIFPNWYGHDATNDKLCEESLLTQFRDTITKTIKGQGVSSYVLLVCNFWYEFSLAGGPDRFGFDFPNRSLTWFDDGNVVINTSTWPQCGRALANLLSLKISPDNEHDRSPTLSQFENKSVFVSSFRVSQRDMFESVKRVTNTTEDDWTITHQSALRRWEEAMALVKQGNFGAFTKMLYSRMFLPTGDADYESRRGLDNVVLDLPVEDLDEWTAVAVQMGMTGAVQFSH